MSPRKPLWTYTIIPAFVVLILFLIFAINEGFELEWSRFGLHPQEPKYWYGIFTFFFLHGSFEHFFNNAVALFVLLSLLRYFFPTHFIKVMLISIIVPAILTFFIGRAGSTHIGASGAVYALAVFLFISGILRLNRYLLGLSLLIAFLYGGLWWGVFPIEERISYEGHFAGAITGFVSALIFIYAPINPEVQEPTPEFEMEDDEIVDRIGDLWKTNYQVDVRYIYKDDTESNTDSPSGTSPNDDSGPAIPDDEQPKGRS